MKKRRNRYRWKENKISGKFNLYYELEEGMKKRRNRYRSKEIK